MTRLAILIQAHQGASQVARLCAHLSHPQVDIYLNVDLKCAIEPFKQAISRVGVERVHFIAERTNVRWGGWSQVEATLRGLRQIRQSETDYSHVLFISGQCYPLRPIEQILAALQPQRGWLHGAPLEVGDPMHRRYQYFGVVVGSRTWSNRLTVLIRRLSPLKRHYPLSPVWKGSSWWLLSGECVEWVLRYTEEHPRFVRFHRHTLCCDELFFHNIVAQSPFADQNLRLSSVQEHFSVQDWSAQLPSPKSFTREDFPAIKAAGGWFARKVDERVDPRLLDLLDELISQRHAHPEPQE